LLHNRLGFARKYFLKKLHDRPDRVPADEPLDHRTPQPSGRRRIGHEPMPGGDYGDSAWITVTAHLIAILDARGSVD
jgi:hypothetical protein